MSQVIDSLERAQLRQVPDFDAGDRVRVHFQVIEGTRRRTQLFEGTVIKRQGQGARETFTVRKQSFGVGVERTFPVHSPKIEELEVASRGDVRRAKLYYLRGRVGRRARVKERQDVRGRAAARPATAPPDDAVEPDPTLVTAVDPDTTPEVDTGADVDTAPDVETAPETGAAATDQESPSSEPGEDDQTAVADSDSSAADGEPSDEETPAGS